MEQEKIYIFDSDVLNCDLFFKTDNRAVVFQLSASLYHRDDASYCHVYVESSLYGREFLPELSFGCKCGSNE